MNKESNNAVLELNNFLSQNNKKVNDWLDSKTLETTPVYSSVDIRNAGFKIAPVDTNLFPSGFNNLGVDSIGLAIQYFNVFFKKHFPEVKRLAVVVEAFTRNANYLDHLKVLLKILNNTGLEIKFVSLHGESSDYAKDMGVEIFQAKRSGRTLTVSKNWIPELVLLNNDLTEEVPNELMDLTIPVLPDIKYGWHSRKKSCHYYEYNELVKQFCQEFSIDPWIISTYFTQCENVSFKMKEGLECIAHNVDKLVVKIQQKYNEYHIKEEPVVFIKANNGTFGRGIISVRNGEEILNINKKLRNSLDVIKGSVTNSQVVIQESISTIEMIENYHAENIIYMVDRKAVGKFARYNIHKGVSHNLNSRGMFFAPSSMAMMPSEVFTSTLATIAVAYENIEYTHE
ncbi:glutamate--cysteine ligase [Candidatus Bandiella euplotis]|uniref:GshA superfamily glutamate-cysteine ligase n=1 Tax=Candidatus Bandiella euplotis TaxID=1664265 RepID=A0ABZ0ULD3_9RICK|nr:glutamate--cysteine ligase [Candidatus Bandiella woodruffii]WPX96529.1 GshA superfamily glutamate-cysteine ligase [Candidatus Bandiella woodruffii]